MLFSFLVARALLLWPYWPKLWSCTRPCPQMLAITHLFSQETQLWQDYLCLVDFLLDIGTIQPPPYAESLLCIQDLNTKSQLLTIYLATGLICIRPGKPLTMPSTAEATYLHSIRWESECLLSLRQFNLPLYEQNRTHPDHITYNVLWETFHATSIEVVWTGHWLFVHIKWILPAMRKAVSSEPVIVATYYTNWKAGANQRLVILEKH